ncbi:hypothetical protein EJ06DRAFT_555524 [Trichodelitschia bisporula]|uniref:Dolichyl-diphosphooligosaccharide-protein glycosyltransferase subunit OST5 n=1 Tax=Trichodelitschia bisporula TaxID=703511 RepID=A0A6G1I0R5_9PEZI|nr:hypothetical protein EJ06DRAFT_555524 [Trichodelitschia bisporula]
MSSFIPLARVAVGDQPYEPFVSKNNQFIVAFVLLLISLTLSGVFALNRSLISLPVVGVPASLAFG